MQKLLAAMSAQGGQRPLALPGHISYEAPRNADSTNEMRLSVKLKKKEPEGRKPDAQGSLRVSPGLMTLRAVRWFRCCSVATAVSKRWAML